MRSSEVIVLRGYSLDQLSAADDDDEGDTICVDRVSEICCRNLRMKLRANATGVNSRGIAGGKIVLPGGTAKYGAVAGS
jgi:hypothetical protein